MIVRNWFYTATFLLLSSLAGLGAQAGTFSIETWRGFPALALSGPIEVGDARRFRDIASSIPARAHGLPILLLDSTGGSVAEALRISEIMRSTPFHTVIPDGANCASACASIVFIAGRNKSVEPFGRLGQHSCSVDGVPDQACNEMLGDHALANGVSHGSVAAFVTHVAPEEILWFSREDADGWGLTYYPFQDENGFEKSEPRVFRAITGRMPPAQAAWRIDFREDGYRAFLRPISDHEREMQMNLFCREDLSGRLFISMEIHGPSDIITNEILGVRVATDRFDWDDRIPIVWQADPLVSEVITEIPSTRIIEFLRHAKDLTFIVALRSPYEPMIATTHLGRSRQALLFAANNCATGTDTQRAAPLR